jgi:8-oxo-dGTP diphosphatase
MIRVTCAIILNEENEVLVVQRGEKCDHPMKWEFPGGKIKEGESEEDCVLREIKEELSMDIVIRRRLDEVEYDYVKKQIVLIPFVCDTLDDLPVLSEHVSFRWLEAGKLKDVDFSEADIIVASNYMKSIVIPEPLSSDSPEVIMHGINDEELKSMIGRMRGTREAEWLANSAAEHPEVVGKLLEYSFSDDRRLAFHASWTLSKVCDDYPEVIQPYLSRIIEALDKLNNESTQRSLLRSISLADMKAISGRHHGLLAAHCFAALKSGFSAIAIKAYSMEILYKLALIYPELTNELEATINLLRGEGSAGIIARGRIVLKRLGKEFTGQGSSH